GGGGAQPESQTSRVDALCRGSAVDCVGFLSVYHGRSRQPLPPTIPRPRRRPWAKPPVTDNQPDLPPGLSLPGVRWLYHPLRLRYWGSHLGSVWRGVDRRHPAVDHYGVVFSDRGSSHRRLVGLYNAGVGWLLGLGSCGERLIHALAAGHGVF